MSNSLSRLRRRLRRRQQRLLVNVVGVDANVDAWNSVNKHRFDVWCFCESSRTFDPAVGLGTSISGVELPPPELGKIAHIPPASTQFSADQLTQTITGHRGLSARDNGGGKAQMHVISLAWQRVYGATRRVLRLHACMWHRWTCCVKEWIIKRPRADYVGTWNLPQKPFQIHTTSWLNDHMTQTRLRCRKSIIFSSTLVQAPSSLFTARPCNLPLTVPWLRVQNNSIFDHQFCVLTADTPLALPWLQERIRLVCSKKVARKCLARRPPAMDTET